MTQATIHAGHPSLNADLLSASPEKAAAAFVACGDLSVDPEGRVWRHRRKVGGRRSRLVEIAPTRAENVVTSGRHQVQVYILGRRTVCLASRLVWFLAHGEIPKGHHIHHKNSNPQDNRLSNLECKPVAQHIAEHSVGRTPWNKGAAYGVTEAYRKSNQRRKENYAKQCAETYSLWRDGNTQGRVAEILGISRRQVCDRLRSYRANSAV